ncbi:polysaccharide pyruvyl transferase family protein [Sphingobium aromaticiconvertens]|uniref:polysaccharide pyruvyl transferase family protein n=1 Tax=Sphingobium aromaticiconvertens TaxID=365341 RepID=UPI003018FD57
MVNERLDNVSFLRLKTQFENVGDALINRELLRKISSYSEIYIDTSKAPIHFSEDVINLSGYNGTVKHIKYGFVEVIYRSISISLKGQRVYYFFLPSGIGGEKSRLSFATGTMINCAYRFMALFGVNFVHLGASYSGLGRRASALLKSRLRLTKMHLVRDSGTVLHLEELRLRCDGLVPDMSFGLYAKEPKSMDKDAIAFSFRVDRGEQERNSVENFVDGIVAQCSDEHPLLFISQVRRDDAFMRHLAKKYGHRPDVQFLKAMSIEETFDKYGRASAIYSNRLHSLLMGAYMGAAPVPVVDNHKDRKIISIFGDIGLAENIVNVGDLPEKKPRLAYINRRLCFDANAKLDQAVQAVFH